MTRVLPIRLVSSAWPSTLLILCEPVWLRSSRLSRMRAPPACSANFGTSVTGLRPAGVVALQPVELGEERGVDPHGLVGLGQLVERGDQGLGDEPAAEDPEVAGRVRPARARRQETFPGLRWAGRRHATSVGTRLPLTVHRLASGPGEASASPGRARGGQFLGPGALDVGHRLLSRRIGEPSGQIGDVHVLEALVDPPQMALRITNPGDPLPEGQLGRAGDRTRARREGPFEGIPDVGHVDAQVSRSIRPGGVPVEEQKHGVADLDLDVADPAMHGPAMREPGVSRPPNTVSRKSISAPVSTLMTHGSTREYREGTRTLRCSSTGIPPGRMLRLTCASTWPTSGMPSKGPSRRARVRSPTRPELPFGERVARVRDPQGHLLVDPRALVVDITEYPDGSPIRRLSRRCPT